MSTELTGRELQLRAGDPRFGAIACAILRSATTRLDRAYKAFFRRVKSGEKPGFPRFRSRDRYDSFSFLLPILTGNLLTIPKLGQVKIHLYRPLKGIPKECHIRRTPTGWYACITVDLGQSPSKTLDPKSAVGIDVGLTSFATFSDGSAVPNPRFFRASEDLLASRQRTFSRKKRKSNSRKRAKLLVAKAHLKIKNQRIDHARKLAKGLANRYDVIAFEDLNIRGMVQNPSLSKSISDASWDTFIQCLKFKAEEAGIWAVGVDPRGTSQRCSKCQNVVKKELCDRVHNCTHCGLILDRDHNAAINIKTLGLSVVSSEISKGISVAEASLK